MSWTKLAVASLLAITFSATVASAATIMVQTDPNGLAFHSRFTTATSGFYELQNAGTDVGGTIYSSPNPGFNGSVMWIAGPRVGVQPDIDTTLGDGVQSYAEYTVRFKATGTYRVHWAGQRNAFPVTSAEVNPAVVPPTNPSPTGDNDSVWIGPTNQSHTGTTGWVALNPITAGGISYRSTTQLWVIDGSNVNTNLTFTVGLREDGPVYDRIAFVREGSGVTPGSLPTTIPEPSSIALVSIVALGLVAARRRRR